jgi:putative transposase
MVEALYWRYLSKRNGAGRLGTGKDIRDLIHKMANGNPTWGSARIHGELSKLGIKISERSVARLMPRRREPPSRTWRTFLDYHVKELVSIDFLALPTATFRVLFVPVVLCHDRRRVVHFNVTEHPTAHWTGEQIIQAFPEGSEPQFLQRNRQKSGTDDWQMPLALAIGTCWNRRMSDKIGQFWNSENES